MRDAWLPPGGEVDAIANGRPLRHAHVRHHLDSAVQDLCDDVGLRVTGHEGVRARVDTRRERARMLSASLMLPAPCTHLGEAEQWCVVVVVMLALLQVAGVLSQVVAVRARTRVQAVVVEAAAAEHTWQEAAGVRVGRHAQC